MVPELDAPAHSGNGYQWGEEDGLGKLAVCVNRDPWEKYCVEPPCGQLNPANPHLYDVLEVGNAIILLSRASVRGIIAEFIELWKSLMVNPFRGR